MHDTTNQDPETTLFPSVPSNDVALATPPVSARAASGAAATRKAPKKPSATQKGSQEPPAPKAGKGAAKGAKSGSKQPAKGTPASATEEPAVEPAAPTAPAKASKPPKKPAPSSMPRSKPALPAQDAAKPWLAKVTDATLADAASGFLAAIEAEGASEATVSGYKRELAVALEHFGADRLLALIAPHEVAAFNESPAVMIARDGAPKAEPSFMRTRRVLRLALCWAVEQGLLETAPLPASN